MEVSGDTTAIDRATTAATSRIVAVAIGRAFRDAAHTASASGRSAREETAATAVRADSEATSSFHFPGSHDRDGWPAETFTVTTPAPPPPIRSSILATVSARTWTLGRRGDGVPGA